MRLLAALLLLLAGLVAAALAYPAAWALWHALFDGDWSSAALTPRRMALILRGLKIALLAAIAAQPIGAGLACGLSARRAWVRGVAAWTCLCVLLTPAYLYGYAWNLVWLRAGTATGPSTASDASLLAISRDEWRAVLCLSTWLAPVAGAILACGWRRAAAGVHRLALLDARPLRAALSVGAPALGPWIAAALATVALLASVEYSICHLCLVQTWNTEVLAEAQLLGQPGHVLRLAWPLLVQGAVLLALLIPLRAPLRQMMASLAGEAGQAVVDAGAGAGRAQRSPAALVAWLLATIAVLAPWAIFATRLRDLRAFGRVWAIYAREWQGALLTLAGAAAATLILCIGLALVDAPRSYLRSRRARLASAALRNTLLFLACAAAIAPPAVIGDAFAGAYAALPPAAGTLLVGLTAMSRFVILALLLVSLRWRSEGHAYTALAQVDGAGWLEAGVRVRLARIIPELLLCAALVGALSFTEIAATILVIPAGVGSIARTLLNAIHFGRDDDVLALCLTLMGGIAVVAAAALAIRGIAARRSVSSRRTGAVPPEPKPPMANDG